MLRRAGAGDADLLIATTGLDEVNIVACSIAGHMGARDTTCFVGRRDLRHTAAGADSLLQHFGIGHVVWPEAQLADAIERIIEWSRSSAAGTSASAWRSISTG